MRKILCLLMAIVLIYSCKKDVDNSGPKNPIYNEPIQFEVRGIQDVTMQEADTVELQLDVERLSGAPELVSLEFIGLPFDLNLEVTDQVDTPSYHTVVRFIATHAATGDFTIKVKAHGSKITKEYPLVLHIVPLPHNPATDLAGKYAEASACTATPDRIDSATISVPGPDYNVIRINGLWTAGNDFNVTADIDPAAHTLNIPFQTINGTNFSGKGSYTNNEIIIHYHVTNGIFVNDSCTTTLSR